MCFSSQSPRNHHNTPLPTMSEEKAYYLVSPSFGLVLAESWDGQPSGVVAQQRDNMQQYQQWTIEYGDEPNTIALRCCDGGNYLHANGGFASATVGTGEKQWWKMTTDWNVTPPHAFRLSPVDFPRVYLNHYQGQPVPRGHPGMVVHMWPWEVGFTSVWCWRHTRSDML